MIHVRVDEVSAVRPARTALVKPRSKVPCENAPIEVRERRHDVRAERIPAHGCRRAESDAEIVRAGPDVARVHRNTRVELLEPRQTVTVDAESSV